MIVKNPTNHDIQVQIEGANYFVEANGEISGVIPEHAAYWKVKLHAFIEIVEESKGKKAEKEVATEAAAPEVAAPEAPAAPVAPVAPAPAVEPEAVTPAPEPKAKGTKKK